MQFIVDSVKAIWLKLHTLLEHNVSWTKTQNIALDIFQIIPLVT